MDLDALADRSIGYDPELAYLTAVLSAWSYADERGLRAKLRYYGLGGARVRHISIENHGLLMAVTAYLTISESGRTAVLTFRGTDPTNLIAWLGDVQIMQRPMAGGLVHAGFYASVEVLWDELHELLDQARRASGKKARLERLFITGHSLGGALALVTTARLFEPDYADWEPAQLVRGVYTFGQPMVGDHSFARTCDERFGDRLFRHVFRRDVIARVPPFASIDYAHAGSEWRAPRLSQPWKRAEHRSVRARLGPALASIVASAVEARTTSRSFLAGPSLDDHAPANYVEVSRRALEASSATTAPRSSYLRDLTRTARELAVILQEDALEAVSVLPFWRSSD